jgi:DNA-binding response OmpR family regulator
MTHILVADDMSMHVDYLKEELENLSYEVSTASDGAGCLKQISTRVPDLVLLDYAMPGMDGLEVLKVLRSEEAYANLPVILLTARKDIGDRVEGLDAGADDYITKPFHIGEVVARIKALLRIRDLQQSMIDREKRLAHVQGVGQTLVTLSHHINNATQSISGMAQLAREDKEDLELHQQMAEVCLRQTERIRLVLTSLHEMVEQMNLKTIDYAGTPDAMLDIGELEEKLALLENKKEADDASSSAS